MNIRYKRKLKKIFRYGCLSLFALAMPFGTAAAEITAQLPAYRTVTEAFDWGPCITKIIIEPAEPIKDEAFAPEDFTVMVKRKVAAGDMPIVAAVADLQGVGSSAKAQMVDAYLNGERKVTRAYLSDGEGREKAAGKFLTLEMEISPDDAMGSSANYDIPSGLNHWVEARYTITGKINGKTFVVNNEQGNYYPQAKNFNFGNYHEGEYDSMPYASFEPQDGKKHPLIIWLHGKGEGGDNALMLLLGNKVSALADEKIQSYFGGAYVLLPQARTYWMHGYKGTADGTSIYSSLLKNMIDEYIKAHPNVDKSRIYVGGCSNGGYMTMLLVRDNPGFFAAAFPVCEGLSDELISDADLENISKTPLWFTAAKTDNILPPEKYSVPTAARLRKHGADVHFSYYDKVVDTTGRYKQKDGTPYEYPGHNSWIYVFNNEPAEEIDGKNGNAV